MMNEKLQRPRNLRRITFRTTEQVWVGLSNLAAAEGHHNVSLAARLILETSLGLRRRRRTRR